MTYFLGVKADLVANFKTLVKQNFQWLSAVFCWVETKQSDPHVCKTHLLRCWAQPITVSSPAKVSLSPDIEKAGSGHVRAYFQPSWGILEIITIPQIQQVVSA